jgi:hypothetical protein
MDKNNTTGILLDDIKKEIVCLSPIILKTTGEVLTTTEIRLPYPISHYLEEQCGTKKIV